MNTEKALFVQRNFDEGAAVYDHSPFFPICGRRLVDLAEIQPGTRVLDIATGTGAVLFPLAEAVGPTGHVTGVDFAPGMVKATEKEIARRGISNADVRQMSAESLDFPSDSFDSVTCGFGLWFIPDMATALSEAMRVLRPGCRFVASTWGPQSWELTRRHNRLLIESGGVVPDLNSHDLTTAPAVSEALTAAGFQVVHCADEEVSAVYVDAEEWWSQRMANAQTNTLSIPENSREGFKQAALAAAREYMQSDGIHENRKAVFAVGLKPA